MEFTVSLDCRRRCLLPIERPLGAPGGLEFFGAVLRDDDNALHKEVKKASPKKSL